MFRVLTLSLALACGACALQTSPEPEVAPPTPSVQKQDLDALRSEMEALKGWLGTLDGRVSTLEPWTARIARLETLTTAPTPAKKGGPKPGREPSGLTLVSQAQKAARVYPTAEGYFGKSGEYTTSWAPGKITVVYLKQGQCTLISLPVGERVVVGLLLDPKKYDVKPETAGQGAFAYDAAGVCPLIERGEETAFVLSKSGRRYLFSFIVGAEGMTAVTFETPAFTPVGAPEPRVALPKPTS